MTKGTVHIDIGYITFHSKLYILFSLFIFIDKIIPTKILAHFFEIKVHTLEINILEYNVNILEINVIRI